ncbi:hypothetical protein J8J14_09520 [Roseomonas sp. SSH11]|uniref:Uncharacterized protein n=1 Tax=Pararoseomonas baculiformis TaxID=2820812 RepID=A0ABS4ADD5_9PROT|nr:hypothetical protein [Pararoseomonas baculiformis]MBP0445018.1 hypothetical protein [Pararoseomonas baculiformis]
MTADTLTILHAHRKRLAKRIRPDGEVDGYDSAFRHDMEERPVAALSDVAGVLTDLQHRTDCAIVRGAIADPSRTRGVRRLVHPDPKTGDQPTLREKLRWYLPLDFDGLPLPEGTDPRDLPACAAAAIGMLPPVFRGAQHIVAATGSHLLKPGARLRLWFWLSRPLGHRELVAWLHAAPVDRSLFRPAQLIYTAAPIFPAGMVDPLPCRTVLVEGRATVMPPSAAALAPPARPITPPPAPNTREGSRYARVALTAATVKVASAPVDSRHPTAVAEAWSLARLVNAGLLTEGEVKSALGWALERAGKTREEAEKIVTWAVAQRGDTGNLRARGH